MKRSTICLITALVVINIVCLVIILCHPEDDRFLDGVYAAPAVMNLGKVNDKKELTGNFYISNISRQAVNILDAKVSCGCLKLNVPKKHMEPGEQMKVTLRANPRGYFGEQTFDAVLTTDHPFTPIVRILLTCHISATVPHESIPTNIGDFTPSAPVDETIDIPYPAEAITLAHIESGDAPDITVTLEEQEEQTDGGGKYKLHILGTAPKSAGPFNLAVDLEARGADWKQAKERIVGTVVPVIQPIDTAAFGFINPGEEITKEIRINNRFPKSIQSADASSQSDTLKKDVVIEKNTPVLRLTLKNAGEPGAFNDTVSVTLRDTDGIEYRVDVPVHAYFY